MNNRSNAVPATSKTTSSAVTVNDYFPDADHLTAFDIRKRARAEIAMLAASFGFDARQGV